MIDDAHLAHGLAGDHLEPDWPPLTVDEVVAVVARVPALGSLLSIDWRSPRPLSAAALATTSSGGVFVKRHHRSVRDAHALGEEHRFTDFLRAKGIPVPRVLRDGSGESVFIEGDWVFELHEPARGVDAYRDAFSWSPIGGVRHARAAGAMLARLHAAAEDFHAPQRGTHILIARAEIVASPESISSLGRRRRGPRTGARLIALHRLA